jgi:hypothetical protein
VCFGLGIVIEVAILATLVLRRSWSIWRSIAMYCICDLGFDIALVSNHSHYGRYFYLYWAAMAANALLRLWILYDVLDSFPGVAFIRSELRWLVAVIGTVMAAGSYYVAFHDTRIFSKELQIAALNLDKCVSVLWGAFYLAALVGIIIFHLGWSRRGAYVANGLLLSTAANVIVPSLLAGNSRAALTGRVLLSIISLASLAIWLFALSQPEEVYSTPPELGSAIGRGRNQLKTT